MSRTIKTGLIGLSQVLAGLGSIISVAVIVRVLNETEYATYRQTLLIYNSASAFMVLGLPKAIYYFLPGENKRSRNILIENQMFLFIMAALLGLFLLLGGNHLIAQRFSNPALEHTLYFLIPYAFFMLPMTINSAVLMARDKPKQVVAIALIQKLVFLSVVVSAALLFRHVPALLAANVIVALIMFLVNETLMFRACPQKEPGISFRKAWSQLLYSIPLGMASILGALNLALDKLIVSSLSTPAEFAIYVNGAMEIPLVPIIIGSVGMVILPDMTALHKKGKKTDMVQIWKRAASKTALILVPVFFMLMFVAEDFIVAVYSDRYLESTVPFRIYLLLLLFRIINTDSPLIASGQSKKVMIRTMISLSLNFVLNIVLVKNIGYNGAAISTVSIIFLWSFPYTLYHVSRIAGLKVVQVYPFKEVGKITLISLAAASVFLLRSLLMDYPPVVRFIGLGGVYTVLVAVLLDRFKMIDLASIVKGVLAKIRKK